MLCIPCGKKKDLEYELYYCFECQIYFNSKKKYKKHMKKRHR